LSHSKRDRKADSALSRHGWGCKADPEKALSYLSAAASNAASIETLALQAGQKGGGAAKGELVLAIFELANSFRHGWGVKKDPFAAKQVSRLLVNSSSRPP
jgi:TPR repeat protein